MYLFNLVFVIAVTLVLEFIVIRDFRTEASEATHFFIFVSQSILISQINTFILIYGGLTIRAFIQLFAVLASYFGYYAGLKKYIVDKADLFQVYILIEMSDMMQVLISWSVHGISKLSMKEVKSGFLNTMKT